MKYTIEYRSSEERHSLLETHADKYLMEEQNITEGNFLIFSDDIENDRPKVYNYVPKVEFEALKQDNTLLKAQAQANADVIEFHEEVLSEIILTIVP